MSAQPSTLAAYAKEFLGLSEDEALQRVPDPVLVQVSAEVDETEQGFHTNFLDPRLAPHRTSDPARREVFRLVKRGDGVFGGHISVGRTKNLDVAIVRIGVSKFHAFFSLDDEGNHQLTDKSSKNGTFVKGERLTPGQAHRVEDGDQVSFGGHAFTFMLPASFVRFVTGREGAVRT